MAAKPDVGDAVESGKAPAKSKKLLIIMVAAVLILALGGGGAFFYISKQRAATEADAEDGEATSASKTAAHTAPRTPPAYLPLDSMVVNLADPGGERVAQVGITLEVSDVPSVDKVKAFLPTIRSSVLMLISQRTAEELLTQSGKQKLAKDILRETSRPFGGGEDAVDEAEPAEASKSKKKAKGKARPHDYPVVGVLFSSFIIQ